MDSQNENVKDNTKLLETIKKRKLLLIISLIIIIALVAFFILRNKMTAEETVSKFMYLVENKEYEKAKKMSTGDLENLELLSNIKPSNLTFKFSKDKKEAEAILLEEEDSEQRTIMNIELDNTLLGWKIEDYKVKTEAIPHNVLQERLENGEELSEKKFLYWAINEETSAEDIIKYADNNLVILVLFSNFMKEKQYEKAFEMYKKSDSDLPASTELTEKEIKNFDWENYYIKQNIETLGYNTYIIEDAKKEINVMIDGSHRIIHIDKDNY